MPERMYKLLETWPFILIAIIGGFARHIELWKKKEIKEPKYILADLLLTGFTGWVVGMICEAARVPSAFTYPLVALAGHKGIWLIYEIENAIVQKVKSWWNKK